ncbi:hypothetical protein As57867_006896, partial [Aphanomyces stellatus]
VAKQRTVAKPPAVIEMQNGVFDIPEVDSEDELDNNDGASDTASEDNNATETAPLAPEPKVEPPLTHVEEEDVIYLPPPRCTAQNKIAFTPRVFPTPSRESKAAEEEDWLLKNRKHLKTHKGLHASAAAQDISESDPVWLKAKGDDFYRNKDFRSAINAYSDALSVDSSLTP